MNKLLTEKQVADRLGLCVQTLRNWRFDGKSIPYIKLGSAVRYDLVDVDSYIEAMKVQPRKVKRPL